jgi:hypothetical protein
VSFKYISDGKGRDFYITYNSGGLQAPYIPGSLKADASFYASLRDNPKKEKVTRFASPKEKERMKKSLISQKMLVQRLTSTNKDWKQINKDYRESFLKRGGKKMSLPGADNTDYGIDKMLTLNNSCSNNREYLKNNSCDRISPNQTLNPYCETPHRALGLSVKAQQQIPKRLQKHIKRGSCFINRESLNKTANNAGNLKKNLSFTNNLAERRHMRDKSVQRPQSMLRIDKQADPRKHIQIRDFSNQRGKTKLFGTTLTKLDFRQNKRPPERINKSLFPESAAKVHEDA